MTRPRLRMNSPVKVYLQINNTCNLDCVQCYTDCNNNDGEEDLSLSEWTSLLDELEDGGVLQLHFEGGEPLLRPDFLPLLTAASERFMVWFRTHGDLIDDRCAAEIARARPNRVIVDLFGANPKTHDYLSGVAGSYDRTIQGVENLRRHGVRTILVCILNRLSVAELQEYVDLAASFDVREVGLLRYYPIGRARENWDSLAPGLEEIHDALAKLKPPESVRIMNGFHPNDSNCCWESAGITSTGRSIGCPYLRELVDYGNIRQKPFLETWNDPLYRQLRTQEIDGDCPDCTHSQQLSPGGCRATAYAFTGRWNAPDPFCREMNMGIDVRVNPPYVRTSKKGLGTPVGASSQGEQ